MAPDLPDGYWTEPLTSLKDGTSGLPGEARPPVGPSGDGSVRAPPRHHILLVTKSGPVSLRDCVLHTPGPVQYRPWSNVQYSSSDVPYHLAAGQGFSSCLPEPGDRNSHITSSSESPVQGRRGASEVDSMARALGGEDSAGNTSGSGWAQSGHLSSDVEASLSYRHSQSHLLGPEQDPPPFFGMHGVIIEEDGETVLGAGAPSGDLEGAAVGSIYFVKDEGGEDRSSPAPLDPEATTPDGSVPDYKSSVTR